MYGERDRAVESVRQAAPTAVRNAVAQGEFTGFTAKFGNIVCRDITLMDGDRKLIHLSKRDEGRGTSGLLYVYGNSDNREEVLARITSSSGNHRIR